MCEILELIRRLLAFASSQPPWLARHRQQQADQRNSDQNELPEPWRFDEEKPLPDAWRFDDKPLPKAWRWDEPETK
jgi:hypothetical protein